MWIKYVLYCTSKTYRLCSVSSQLIIICQWGNLPLAAIASFRLKCRLVGCRYIRTQLEILSNRHSRSPARIPFPWQQARPLHQQQQAAGSCTRLLLLPQPKNWALNLIKYFSQTDSLFNYCKTLYKVKLQMLAYLKTVSFRNASWSFEIFTNLSFRISVWGLVWNSSSDVIPANEASLRRTVSNLCFKILMVRRQMALIWWAH